jgi:uncharacterized RDD family membrane protein YckC
METISDDHFAVETPENIRFGYDIADIGSRALAVLIDSLLQGVLYAILFFSALILEAGVSGLSLPSWANELLVVLLILSLFLIQFGYFILLEIFLNGQTPGKRLLKLRVIKENGYPLSALDSIVRNLVRIIDFFPIFYGVGILTMFLNRRAKRLGDFAAGTLVVKLRDQVKLQSLLPLAAADSDRGFAPPALGGLDEHDIELAESFLRRRKELVNAGALAQQLVQRFAARMETPAAELPTTPDATVAFLQRAVQAFRGRQ